MAALIERARNEGFLLEEANGGISRDVVTLASGLDYTSGSVVINVGGAPTWSLVTAAALEAAAGDPDAEPPVAAQEVKVGIVCRHTDASAAAHKAAIIARHAEVFREAYRP